jgi:quinoprotein glucose dehydrogenase
MFALPGLGQMMNTQNGEWATYGGNLANWRYSPLDQINADNFGKLEVAWRFNSASLGPQPEYQFEGTPLEVHGVIYTTAGTRRAAVALDAATGEELWMHSMNEGERGANAPRKLSGHGLAYWTDGKEERILYVTPGYRLVALDAKTGAPVTSFGENGVVDLKLNDDQKMDLDSGSNGQDIGLHSTPIVTGNTVIVGAAHLAGGNPPSKTHVKGYVRGFDVRTGKRLWIFHTIPLPGEFGSDTWLNGSNVYTGNTGVWGQISVDEQLGLIYLPVELPTGDYYGGDRPGAGLFGESIVALDSRTGKRKWHYQLVHHGFFDMDIPCAPMLVDLNINGQTVKALAQPTKQSYLYVFNRETGKPIWPITETPEPKGDVPGEWYSPTQPIPSKPPAYDRQGVTEDDLIDFTPELHAAAVQLVQKYKIGPLFTPPVVSQLQGPLATIHLPGSTGGANWPGGSWDPETHRLYIYSQTSPAMLGLVPPDPKVSSLAYIQGIARAPDAGARRGGGGLQVQGLPLIKPPWGRITAFDLDKGEILWQVAHGDTPDNVKNNPALKGLNIPRTGRPGIIGVLTTKTLVIAGESSFVTTPNGRGAMLRAYDKATGKEVGAVYLPAPQSGSPMTYTLNGRQYLVLAISGPGFPGELIAFRLPVEGKQEQAPEVPVSN